MTDTERVQKMLADAKASRFWGTIQVDLQDGDVTIIRRSETFKLKREGDKRDGQGYR